MQSNYNYLSPSFQGYTPKQICADLCKGACCNHGTVMNANLKIIVDKLCASCKTLPDDARSVVLIKTPVVKWIVSSNSCDVQKTNELVNTYIDAISKESNPEKIKLLQNKLDKLNKKLLEITGENEVFLPITNAELTGATKEAVVANGFNVCMFKDHGKTNLCTIYNGVKDETGKTIGRPSPCLDVGSDKQPCPWHNPEKYGELLHKTRTMLAKCGYNNLPTEVLQKYVAQQYNLNEVFLEKIWKPYLKSLGVNV